MKKHQHLALLCVALLLPLAAYPAELAGEGRITSISSVELADLISDRSGKVVLVNFWASWCAPCLKEIPELVELDERYKEKGFELLPVSLDSPGDIEIIVVPFLNKWFPDFITYARVDAEMDTVVSVVDSAWNEILPTSYLLARDGSVAERIQGGQPIEIFEQAIVPLLDE